MGSNTALISKTNKINLTDRLTDTIKIIIQNTSIFSHIDAGNVLVFVSTNKKNGRGGTYGKLVPLKFKDGESIQKFNGKYYTIPGILNNGIPQLYIIYFYIPRFFDLDLNEKLRVIFHELYHISGDFNGDIRRMGQIKKAHGFSSKRFNSLFQNELNAFYEYIRSAGIAETDFLKMDTA
ncbi:MAG: hypothetical protein MUC95_05120, partial [Spirochaetes bacterium]|nr:hypothetical protein [Spirochaetota bacterium]